MTDHVPGTPEQLPTPPTPPSDLEVTNRYMNRMASERKAQMAFEWLKEALGEAQEYKTVDEKIISDLEDAVEGMRHAESADDLESLKWQIEGLLVEAEQDWESSNSEADDALTSLEEIDLSEIRWP